MNKLFKKLKKSHHGRRVNEKKELNKGMKRANEEFIYLSNPMDNGRLKPITQQQRNMQDFLQVSVASAQLRKRTEQNGQALKDILKKLETDLQSKKIFSHDSIKAQNSSHLWR